MTIAFKILLLAIAMASLGLMAGIFLVNHLLVGLVGLGLVAVTATYALVQDIEQPLKELQRWVSNVIQPAGANQEPALKLTANPAGKILQRRDQIGQLAQVLQTVGTELQQSIQHLTATTAAKERLESELRIGRSIQMDMLTLGSASLPNRKDLAISATLQPAREVGGDFYDCYFLREQLSYLLGEHRFCFCIGDTSGKGVPAALFTAVMKTLIKSQSYIDLSPANVLTHVNQIVSENNPSCMFTTIFFGVLNLLNGEMVYANAGHNPPYLRRQDGTLELLNQRHGPAIGILEEITYKEDKLWLNTGDLVVIYTDGVTEAMDPDQNLFSDQRFAELLRSQTDHSPEAIITLTTEQVLQFQGTAEQADDITLLAFQYLGVPNLEGDPLNFAIDSEALSKFKQQWK
ncbi:MAG TPA: PP2C family protein-serine/threonine phosphatase [Leptolyngbyaceae cyanobacterium M65_K2018_010]|nr:PP2C family protein-serine/threonine phosphatase [Leptolyngbyaceae cyanobacterium M65_K2018_010]